MKRSLIKNLLFAIMPKGLCICLLFAIWFRIGDEGLVMVSNLILNLLLVFVGFKAAILIHEAGHLIFGKLAGATPRRMVLGKGHEIFRKEIKGIKIIVNSKINSGAAYAAFDDIKNIKTRLLVYYSGGIVANFLVGLLLFLAFGFNLRFSDGVHPASMIAYINLLTGVIALVPYKVTYEGRKLSSDGLSILRIPFKTAENLAELKFMNTFLDAADLYEARDYKGAIELYEKCLQLNPELKYLNISLGAAYLKTGNFDKARELVEALLPEIEEKKLSAYKGIIYNLLAWISLVSGDIESADRNSELAFRVDSRNEYFRGTRGAILVEKGEYLKGRDLLLPNFNLNYVNSQTLTSAIYLAVVYEGMDQPLEAAKFRAFAEKNMQKMEIDEQQLYARTREKQRLKNTVLN